MGDSIVFADHADGVHLVLHQGDEGGDDDGGPFHHQGGELVAQGFSAAGGHQDKRVPPFNQMLDDAQLVTLEGVEAEKLLQLGLKDGGVEGHSPRGKCHNLTNRKEKTKFVASFSRKILQK